MKKMIYELKNGIEAIYSSPYNSRSQGLAEAYCKVHKTIMKKSDNFEDFLRRLRVYRNTPRSNEDLSPAELFTGRIQRTEMPILEENLREKIDGTTRRKSYENRIEKSRISYQKRRGQLLKSFEKNDLVILQNPLTKLWNKKGKIIGFKRCGHSKSYIVLSNGQTMVRNAKFLKLLNSNSNKSKDDEKSESANNHLCNFKKTKSKSLKELRTCSAPTITRPITHKSCLKHASKISDQGYLFNESTPSLRRSNRLRRVRWAEPSIRYFNPGQPRQAKPLK